MRAVHMYENIIADGFIIHISCNVVPFFDDKRLHIQAVRQLPSNNTACKACSNNDYIIFHGFNNASSFLQLPAAAVEVLC